jgi:hypothetical protein
MALTTEVRLRCFLPAVEVEKKLREVLDAIEAAGGTWPTVTEWERRLPSWFTKACPPPLSQEEAEGWLERWRALPPDEKEAAAKNRWSLVDWLHWVQPENSVWRWVRAEVRGPHDLSVWLEVEGWPAPLGAFEWLARAAGAEVLLSEDQR